MTDREEAAACRALVAFTFYTIFWQSLVWIGGMTVIVGYDWNPWFVALLVFMSGSQFRLDKFRTDRKDGHE